MVINKSDPHQVEAVKPETIDHAFKAVEFDKDHSFHTLQERWFQKKLTLGEQINMSAEQLKMICDESHEMGRLRERMLKVCDCPIEM